MEKETSFILDPHERLQCLDTLSPLFVFVEHIGKAILNNGFLHIGNIVVGWNGDRIIFIDTPLHFYFVSLTLFLLLLGAFHSWTRSPDRSHASDQGFTLFHPLTPLYKKVHASIYQPYTLSVHVAMQLWMVLHHVKAPITRSGLWHFLSFY